MTAVGQGLDKGKEPKFPVLHTKTAVYKNVTVTQVTRAWIFILHDNGVCNVKAEDLLPETRVALGMDKIQADDDRGKSGQASRSFAPLAQKLSAVTKLATDWQQNGKQRLDQMTAANPMALYLMLGILAVTYIVVSALFWMICRKTHNSPGPLVWVPVLQLIPLLRAANMSRVWFMACIVPVGIVIGIAMVSHALVASCIIIGMPLALFINIIATIVWAVKICKTRGKSPFVAFLLILPPTSVFAFLYLAFSRSAPVQIQSNEPLALSFA